MSLRKFDYPEVYRFSRTVVWSDEAEMRLLKIIPPFWTVPISPRWINPSLGLVLLMICGLVANIVITARQSDFDRAAVAANNISAAVSQDIRRNLELYDLSLLGAVEAVNMPNVMTASKELRQLILFDRAAAAPYLGQILVLDRNGDTLADSTKVDVTPKNYADSDFFRIHMQQPSFGLYLSRPLVARLDGGRVIALSRRISAPDGSFGGVVVGTVRLDYIHALFRQIKMGPGGSLTLFRKDGVLLMREPYDPAQIGLRLDPPELFDRASRAADGEYQAQSAVDGVNRLYHFRRIGDLPLVQNVGFSIDDIYADWWRRTLITVLVLGLCCAIITGLTIVLGRELRRRATAEQAFQALSETDGLTGLANRRRFDHVFDLEWSRALRDRQPLALLMIDADQFKLFNDTFGHAAGDAALKQLAVCLNASARRMVDLVTRYGGEEFAILLPATDQDGALKVAERARIALSQRAIPHQKALHGHFTISIGVASLVPRQGQASTDLIGAADAALYASKNNGRNTVSPSHARVPLRRAS